MYARLVFNADRCLACRSCELACSLIHSRSGRLEGAVSDAPPPRRRLTIAADERGLAALRCEQCLEPLCAFTCKSGALRRDPESGRIILDENRCLGCFMCLMVCPFGIRPDPATDRVVRCDLCRDLETPACVTSCPTGALGTETARQERAQGGFTGHVVIVGSSAAGMAACEAAREHAPGCSITLVTADASPQYSRPLLAYVLAGRIERHDLSWRADAYLADDLRVRVLSGVRATELRSDAGPLVLGNGMELTFDALVLATGARPVIPAIPGAALGGVSPLRNLDDLEAIEGLIAPGRRAVVLGGGNVGLQVCEALRSRGMNVTVVVTSPHLLSQMVDAEVGCRVAKLFTDHGVTVRTGRDATEIVGSAQVEAVRLDDGELIGADLVVVGKGIRPNVEWLRGSGITIGTGIVVDPCGRTSVPGIFAAGDCAEVTDPLTGRPALSGIWPIAYEVGRAAGSAAVGVDRPSRGPLRMNASRFFGVPVISIGEVLPDRLEGGSAQVLVDREASYRKLVHCRGRLAGALLYGDVSGAGILYRLYREGVDVGDGIAAELEEKRLESVLAPLIAAAGTDRPDAPPGVAHGE